MRRLMKTDFEVRNQVMMRLEGGGVVRGDWSVGITVDVMNEIYNRNSTSDTIAICTGSGRMADLFVAVNDVGYRTAAIGFRADLSSALIRVASEFHLITNKDGDGIRALFPDDSVRRK